jgi:aspartate racemase
MPEGKVKTLWMENNPRRFLGILGGMGPAASADFLIQLASVSGAACDQQHLPVIMWSDPQTPDRSKAIVSDGESPLPSMLRGLDFLKRSGANAIAIPCVTAYHWYDAMLSSTPVPIFNIADAVCCMLKETALPDADICLLATSGTIASGFYEKSLRNAGYNLFAPSFAVQQTLDDLIGAVKAGAASEQSALRERLASELARCEAGTAVLGCTELCLALRDEQLPFHFVIDSSRALARACVRWWKDEIKNP